ncbi:ribonuclease domain-containing protein [Deinococcus indicus]|uniref:ribonuclease domain-containing protein n=1 Tax=Deinococcus indicus TaxID=223556 RepID=UPI0019A50C6C|nr:ribonuclease domain-containing protein [Deinococcus indicus]GHG34909.1 hypothetical protein GCM10017784_31070 [Deinococcus indicus]
MNRAAPTLAALLLGALLAACDLPQDTRTQPTTTQTAPAPTRPAPTTARDPHSGLRWITARDLPREGQTVLRQISEGGPFRYGKDGSTFGNRERLLPRQNSGYYREYTVPTPGENDRGARRLVCGGQPRTSTADCYYTADHYASFRRVQP